MGAVVFLIDRLLPSQPSPLRLVVLGLSGAGCYLLALRLIARDTFTDLASLARRG